MVVKCLGCNYEARNYITVGCHCKLFHQDKSGDVSVVINYSVVFVLKMIFIIMGLMLIKLSRLVLVLRQGLVLGIVLGLVLRLVLRLVERL